MNLTEAQKLAEELMNKHLPANLWSFKYFSSINSLGLCRHNSFNSGEICLNEDYVLNADIEDVRLTILHEIAHAMVGHRHGHNRVWAHTCQAIGGRAERLVDNKAMRTVLAQNAKYIAVCPSCNEKYYISRLGRRAKEGHKHCSHCVKHYGFSDKTKLTWHINY